MKSIVVAMPRVVAVLFALLMLGPVVPPANAADQPSEAIPRIPLLPTPQPGDQCVESAVLPLAVAGIAAAEEGRAQYWAQTQNKVPAFCAAGQDFPQEYAIFMSAADAIVRNLTSAEVEVQRQLDQRLDAIVPRPVGCASVTPAAALDCKPARPQFSVLDDRFDGHRVGGFGNWTAYAPAALAPSFHLDARDTFNGTIGSYRFGTNDGYAHGAHEWLVSPELDLSAVNDEDQLASFAIAGLKQGAYDSIARLCAGQLALNTPFSSTGGGQLPVQCNLNANQGFSIFGVPVTIPVDIVQAYQTAIAISDAQLPITQQPSYVDITYRMNMATAEDGVRVWIFAGDHAPTRAELFDPHLGEASGESACATNVAIPTQGGLDSTTENQSAVSGVSARHALAQAGARECFPVQTQVIGFPGMQRVAAFKNAAQPQSNVGFSGDVSQPVTVRYNLTPFDGQRVWMLFEVATNPVAKGDDAFHDATRFGRFTDFGFELEHVNATAEGFLRDFRLKDVGANYPRAQKAEVDVNGTARFHGVVANATRIVLPPASDPIAIRLQNAGQYVENGTVSVVFHQTYPDATRTFTTSFTENGMRPSETRSHDVAWPADANVREGQIWTVNATLQTLGDAVDAHPTLNVNNVSQDAAPNATPARPPNIALLNFPSAANSASGATTFWAHTRHSLTLENAAGSPIGATLEVCQSVSAANVCAPLFSGKKAEPRILLTAVRNNGAVPEDATAVLTLTLNGVSKPEYILDGAAKDLPGVDASESRVVTWSLAPAEAGTYVASVSLLLKDGTAIATFQRLIFVQRTTGLTCFDNLGDDRECAAAFQSSFPDGLDGGNVTASYVAPDGTAYVATQVEATKGGLYVRQPGDSTWTLASKLDRATLGQRQAGTAVGIIRAMTLADGVLYMAGDNLTILSRTPDGSVTRGRISASIVQAFADSGPFFDIMYPETPRQQWFNLTAKAEQQTSTSNVTSGFFWTNETNVTSTDVTIRMNGVAAGPGAPPILPPNAVVTVTLTAPNGNVSTKQTTIGTNAQSLTIDVVNFTAYAPDDMRLKLNSTDEARAYVVANNTQGVGRWRFDMTITSTEPQSANKFTLNASAASNHWNATIIGEPHVLPGLRSVAVYNGTVYGGGEMGMLLQWNAHGRLVSENLPFAPCGLPSTFGNTINALLVDHDQLLAAGDQGAFFARNETSWRQLPSQEVDNGCGHGVGHASARDIVTLVNDGQNILATGSGNLVMHGVATDPDSENITQLNWTQSPPISLGARIHLVLPTGMGTFVAGDAGRVARCDACASPTDAQWTFPEVPVPDVVHGAQSNRAALTTAGSGGSSWFLAGEGGVVLDYVARSATANTGDWTTSPDLVAHDGGVLQTLLARKTGNEPSAQFAAETGDSQLSYGEGYRGVPAPDGALNAAGASKLRVTLHHHVDVAWPDTPVVLRVVWVPYPSTTLSGVAGASTCPQDNPPTNTGAFFERALVNVCRPAGSSDLVQEVARWEQATPTAGWVEYQTTVDTPTGLGARPGTPSTFGGVELYKSAGVQISTNPGENHSAQWAIDDITVEATHDGVTWQPVVWWRSNDLKSGAWDFTNVENDVNNQQLAPTRVGSVLTAVEATTHIWVPNHADVFGREVNSAWHISTNVADRPVFAVNDEQFTDTYAQKATPHLRDNWNTRLVSPVLDLSQAYDPVVSWRQLYNFRSVYIPANPDASAKQLLPNAFNGDVGRIEVQYLKTPAECGDVKPVGGDCWSNFFPVRPTGDYPNVTSAGFPGARAATDANASGTGPQPPKLPSGVELPEDPHAFGLNETDPTNLSGRSYWGHNTANQSAGVLTDIHDTSRYQTASVNLADVTCGYTQSEAVDQCPGVSLAGRLVRVAFHVETGYAVSAGGYDEKAEFVAPGLWSAGGLSFTSKDGAERNLGGQGWYITDFKVAGTRDLGINLAATKPAILVGYDPAAIGVGPGTTVNVGTTVTNRGIYDADGYTGKLDVALVMDAAAKKTLAFDHVTLEPQPSLAVGASRPHSLRWQVPTASALAAFLNANAPRADGKAWQTDDARGPSYVGEDRLNFILTTTITPLGIDRDEDFTDNVVSLGTFANPVHARTYAKMQVELQVTPESATSDFTRAAPIFLRNLGNVPLGNVTTLADGSEGFEPILVYRNITHADKSRDANRPSIDASCGIPDDSPIRTDLSLGYVELRCYQTTAPVPPGERVPLARVASGVNPGSDLIWQPTGRGSFLFSVGAATGSLHASTTQLVKSLGSFIFDDVDQGVTGESFRGDWTLNAPWNVTSPGFSSAQSYGFGDPLLFRYPASTDASLVTPTIDLSAARAARVAFYHRYSFEPGFDAGVLEASADNGTTWQKVPALRDDLNNLPIGYNNSYPLAASSPLHATGNPNDITYGFTGDTRQLPGQVDGGWIISQFDLTSFRNITEANVAYEKYGSAELSAYRNGTSGVPKVDLSVGPQGDTYSHPSWTGGFVPGAQQWLVQNLTEHAVCSVDYALAGQPCPASPTADAKTFWWSGSASLYDDKNAINPSTGKFDYGLTYPHADTLISIPVDFSKVDTTDGTKVVVDWWEWAQRYGTSIDAPVTTGDVPLLLGAVGDAPAQAAQSATWRYNVTMPVILAKQGQWLHMQSDITAFLAKSRQFNIEFGYSPYQDNPLLGRDKIPDPFQDDRGFAIDNFHVQTFKIVNGQPTGTRTLVDEDSAWLSKTIKDCDLNMTTESAGVLGRPASYTGISGRPCHFGKIVDNLTMTGASPRVSGQGWAKVAELPAIDSAWSLVSVQDHTGATPKNPPPTREIPTAWYSGDLGPRSASTVAPDVPLASHLDKSSCYQPCVRPGAESRLVTPAVDLSRIAGTDANFVFWHRYAFQHGQYGGGTDPLATGGVVEIQVLDSQTGEWGAWKQIYARPDNMTVGNRTVQGQLTPLMDANERGGYSYYTTNASPDSYGHLHRYDPPFEAHPDPKSGLDIQYLYSGLSTTLSDAHPENHGWLNASYDVSSYIGKKVRFGFHVVEAPVSVTLHQNVLSSMHFADDAPEHGILVGSKDMTGWWISDVAISGKVLNAAPVELRLRAATDGDQNDGLWQVDEFGVFGARYGRNVGLFANLADGAYGSGPGTTTTVPIQIRNLGDSVRRDLAVEVRLSTPNIVAIAGDAPPGGQVSYQTENNLVRFEGYTLAPGQSATLPLRVTTHAITAENPSVDLVLRLVEKNPAIDGESGWVKIKDNEVQGILERNVRFALATRANVSFDAAISPAAPRAGDAVHLLVNATNVGYLPATLAMACGARTLESHAAVDHARLPNDVPVALATYACKLDAGALQLAPGATTTLDYNVTPTTPGILQVNVNGTVLDNLANATIPDLARSIAVDASAVLFAEHFTQKPTVQDNWSREINRAQINAPGQWSYLRGHDAAGALLLGTNESNTRNPTQDYSTACKGGTCVAESPPIDLHNYTAPESLYLTFYQLLRFAKHDGGNVYAQVLVDETSPNVEGAWTKAPTTTSNNTAVGNPVWCALQPIGGYTGVTSSFVPTPPPPNQAPKPGGPPPPASDLNPAAFAPAPGTYYSSPGGLNMTHFVSPGGQWSESWEKATFDLSNQPYDRCQLANLRTPGNASRVSLVGHTIRLMFRADVGSPAVNGDPNLDRGAGNGWIIDDITVSPQSLTLRPADQTALVVDNSSKTFNVLLRNDADAPDLVRVAYDDANSSAPQGSIATPLAAIALGAHETKIVPIRVTLPRDPTLLATQYKARIFARSLRDPNVADATTLTLDFAPRQFAELSLKAEAPQAGVQVGTESFIPVTVENDGLLAAGKTSVLVVDQWDGGVATTTLQLDALPSFFQNPELASAQLPFNWRPDKDSVGMHTLTFTVDPDQKIEQYTRSNDIVTLRVPVTQLLIPDLDATNASALKIRNSVGAAVSGVHDADVTHYEVTSGEVVSLETTVQNHGRAGAVNVDVRAFIGSLSLPAKQIPFIPSGGEASVTFNWQAQKGEYPIEFIVRSDAPEITTANNRFPGRGVALLTVKGFDVSVDVPAIAGILEPGATVDVPFTLANAGNAGEDLVLSAEAPAGASVVLPRESLFLRSGDSYSGVASLRLSDAAVAGEQFMSIHAVSATHPMKVATARAGLTVRAFYGGSVESDNVSASLPELAVPVTLHNEGNSLEAWSVALKLPAGWSAKETLPMKVSVPAHGAITTTIHVRAAESTAPGVRAIGVSAKMPNGESRAGTLNVDVRPLRSAGVTMADAGAKSADGAIAFPIVVENTGNVAQPFQLVLTDVPAGVAAKLQPARFELPPGGRAVASLLVTPSAAVKSGEYTFKGYAAFAGVSPDTVEGARNAQTLKLSLDRPDAHVATLDFAPRADLQGGQKIAVKVPVFNAGSAPLADVPVHLFVDDLFVQEAKLSALAPGEKRDVTMNWTAVPGQHTFTVVVDPYNDTIDANREDNAVSALVTVAGAGGSAAVGQAAGKPVPGFDAPVLALAFALAMALGALAPTSKRSRRPPK